MNRFLSSALTIGLLVAGAAAAQEQQQVNVSVRIIEFQTTKGVETGLSAYFRQRNEPRPYGRAESGNGNVTTADLTFPTTTAAGITVFLDQLTTGYGDFELVLQALIDENRAFILSQPKALVQVGQEVPTVIQTVQDIPYETTTVVGATAVQTTSFRPTGVTLDVKANQVIDDDGNPNTTNDTFMQLTLSAVVNEEGQRITVALDDLLASGGGVGAQTSNAISVPEFVSRSINTTVWMRHGQVLILGGLYRNTKTKDLETLPWLTQGEDLINGVVQRFVPLAMPQVPLSAGLGHQDSSESRRELVFLIKCKMWRPAFTVAEDFGFTEEEETQPLTKRLSPTNMITGVLEEISDIPQGIAEELAGEEAKDEVTSNLGGGNQ